MAAVGEVVAGRYRLTRPLTSSGMSRIWLATDESAGRVGTTYGPSGEIRQEARPAFVVLKHCTIPPGLTPAQHELVRRWALPEATAAASIRHPHVIRTHTVIPSWDGPWLVMEHLPSRTLQQVVDESGPLPVARAAALGLAVLSGLRAAWRSGILHLDVKPGNVLITADGRAVLTDFGPAVTPTGVGTLTDAGIILGSPKWIAPERIFDHTSTEASDMWSFGATLYHAVEGRTPFPRATTSQILRALADPHPTPPRRAGPLTPVLTALLRRHPGDRMPAAEVEARLHDIVTPGHRRRAPRFPFRTPHRRPPAADTPHPAPGRHHPAATGSPDPGRAPTAPGLPSTPAGGDQSPAADAGRTFTAAAPPGDSRLRTDDAFPTDGLTGGSTGGLTDGLTNGPAGGPASGLTDGPTGGLTGGLTSGLTDGPTDGLTGGPDRNGSDDSKVAGKRSDGSRSEKKRSGRSGRAPAARRRRIPAVIAAVAVAAGLSAVAATAEGMTRSGTSGAPPASSTGPDIPASSSAPGVSVSGDGPGASGAPGRAGPGPADEAAPGPAGGAGPGPAGGAAPGPAGGAGPGPAGGAGTGSAEGTGTGTAPGFAEEAAPGSAEGTGSAAEPGSASSPGPLPELPPISDGPGAGPTPPAPLPDGFSWWADPLGYRVAVPDGWRRGTPPTGGLTFTARRDRAAMGITPLAAPPSDVVATLAAAERASALPDYQRVRIQALPQPSEAVWEYTFQDSDGTGMQALQRIIGTATRSYVLEWRATREAWPTELNRFTVVLASFTPGP
ncbi:serine/threonine-protein kinase [Actinoplanes sp. G11-F43]|uniref:serine/threonine-protein kinase n=1 Tax=Actinoplanes sp. G11-F43 TaxID=3424130 RepID=UPI003D3342E1